MFGYDPKYKNPYRLQNLAKGKQLLKEAGYPDGIDPKTGKPLNLTLVYQYRGPESQREEQYYIEQFDRLGIRLTIKSVTWSEMQNITKKGNFQMTRYGWFADYPDAENFMFLAYGKSGPDVNITGYNNPEFNRLYEKMQTLENTPERLALLNKMRAILDEDCPLLYTFNEAFYTLSQGWTHNVSIHPVAFNSLKYYRVDSQIREVKQQVWNRPNYMFVLALVGLFTAAIIPVALSRREP